MKPKKDWSLNANEVKWNPSKEQLEVLMSYVKPPDELFYGGVAGGSMVDWIVKNPGAGLKFLKKIIPEGVDAD